MIHWPRSEFPALVRLASEREIGANEPKDHPGEGLLVPARTGFTGAGVGPLSTPVAGANR